MSIRKHKQSGFWWVDITAPGGQRVRRSTGTTDKAAAQEFHDRLKTDLWRQHHFGERARRSFEEACVQFLNASQDQKDYRTKVRHVKYWLTVFAGRSVCSLTTDDIMNGLPTHRTYEGRPASKLTPATQNRYLASMARILSLAADAGWIDRKPKLQMAREAAVRVRWLTQAKAEQFLRAIRLEWVRDACEFALATGCRANEIFSLTWDKVDLDRSLAWVTNDLAKSGRARAVPLNEHAMEVVKRRQGTHASLVFSRTWAGARIEQVDRRAFTAALQEVGLKDFRFHDLRHTWASWHVQNGTPLFVLKELGGWETLDMVKKYAHLDAGHLAQYANHVTFRSQQAAGKKKAA